MKKTSLSFLFIVTAAFLFAQNGTIRELNGTVELKDSGASSFVTAKSGDKVKQDTVVSTGFKSSALVAVGIALITVRPLTRLTLTEIRSAAGTESLNVNLQAGRVRVDVNPPSGTRTSMTVSSPVATASVRGTSFELDTRNLWVNSGKVSFMGKSGKMMQVSGGYGSNIQESGKAADPLSVTSSGLVPPAPVGADSSGSGSDVQSSSGTMLVINIGYGTVEFPTP